MINILLRSCYDFHEFLSDRNVTEKWWEGYITGGGLVLRCQTAVAVADEWKNKEWREIKDVGRGVKLWAKQTGAARLLYNLKKAIYLCVSISPSFWLWIRLPAILRG